MGSGNTALVMYESTVFYLIMTSLPWNKTIQLKTYFDVVSLPK